MEVVDESEKQEKGVETKSPDRSKLRVFFCFFFPMEREKRSISFRFFFFFKYVSPQSVSFHT